MSELEQLKHGVQNLSSEDFAKFRAWFLKLDTLLDVQRKIAVELEQAERGELLDGEEVIRDILKKL